MNQVAISVLLIPVLLLSGCRTLKTEPVLPSESQIPLSFSQKTKHSASNPIDRGERFWEVFGNDELTGLIEQVQSHNFDIKTLESRIERERANLKKEQSSFFPDLDFSFGGQKRERKERTDSNRSHDGSHSWDAGLTSLFTADIWGKLEAGEQSRRLALMAAELDLTDRIITVTTRAAQTWIDVIAARNERMILDQQVEINRTLLELQKLRFSNGQANALDVSQQREALAEASSQKPLVEKNERLSLNSLAVLSGKTDMGSITVTTQVLPEPVPLPDVGIPADLLNNRPDIQAAWLRVEAAGQDVREAEAERLPSLNLSAQALFSSGELDLLFQNWVASLAADITGPIFDAGLRQAEVERTMAVAREQVQLYVQTVSQAIREVEDSLVSIDKQEDFIRLLEEELTLAGLTLKDAMLQYRNGQSSYLNYLTAWSRIEFLERQLIRERATYLKERIGLYAALGWQIDKRSDEDRIDGLRSDNK